MFLQAFKIIIGVSLLFMSVIACNSQSNIFNRPSQTQLKPAQSVIEGSELRPDIFVEDGSAIWSGAPSLGGRWVASKNATLPARVLVTNLENNKQITAALLVADEEDQTEGLRLSSQTAQALDVPSNQSVSINITALRPLGEANAISQSQLKTASPPPQQAPAPAPPKNTIALAPAQPASGGYSLQLGVFSVKTNVDKIVSGFKAKNILISASPQTSNGRTLYLLTAGPFQTKAEALAHQKTAKAFNINDSFIVKK